MPERQDEPAPTGQRDIVVLGASAGGVEALSALVGGLPAELPAAVLVVLHVLPSGRSVLPSILDRASRLPATAARDGEPVEPGRIYVAPPGRHMVLEPGRIVLADGPPEHGHRPAVDALFRSAAGAYGERVIGAVLSGSLDDGTEGLGSIKGRGGVTVAQDPSDALYPGMPRSAIDSGVVDRVAPIAQMAGLLCELLEGPPKRPRSRSDGRVPPDEAEPQGGAA